jgi:hypothetical protein
MGKELDSMRERIEEWRRIKNLKAKDCIPLIEKLEENNLEEAAKEKIILTLDQVDSKITRRICPLCKARVVSVILVRDGYLPVISNVCCDNEECKKTLMKRVFEGEDVYFEKLSVRNIQNLPKKFWKAFASILDEIFS